jgi:GNAT superfamily N-acetyltransferase
MLAHPTESPEFQVRPALPEDAPRIAAVHVASWIDAYRGILPPEVLQQQSVERRRAQWAALIPALRLAPGRQALLVGTDPAACVQGFIHGGVEREAGAPYDAEVYALYLHPSAQRRGLGARLLGHLCEWLQGLGHRTLRLWMLEGNPAEGFYRRVGGRLLPETQQLYFAEKPFRHLAFGWDDLAALAARLPR